MSKQFVALGHFNEDSEFVIDERITITNRLAEYAPELLQAAEQAMDEHLIYDPESKAAQRLARAIAMAKGEY